MKKVIYFLFIINVLFFNFANAYDNKTSHKLITEESVKQAVIEFGFNNYLINNFGFSDGINTTFSSVSSSKQILDYLKDGSELEDTPMCRASNHFHDPTKSWDQSYMSDDTDFIGSKIRAYCELTGWTYANRKSNVTWATGFLTPPPDGQKASFSTDPDFAPINWDKAREYYYNALTSLSKTDKETKFALTFKALGHVMHLLEDVSVPAHVRNDFTSHLTFNGINSWVPTKWVIQPFEHYVKINPNLVTSAQPTFPSFTNLRLTDFWDTNQFNDNNPPNSTSIGLAEYSNGNFLSDTTIFKGTDDPLHSFPYPDWSKIVEYDEIIDGEVRTYIKEIDGEPLHLAVGKWFYKYIPSFLDSLKKSALKLDDKCHYDYAQKLIPRAVGYSAVLLNYFFRGTLEITMPNAYVYSIIDGSAIPQQFTRITAKVRNSTPDSIPGEEIQGCDIQQQNCIIQAVAKYKIRPNYQADLSNDPPTETEMQGVDFSYSVSTPIAIDSLSSTTPTEFTFDFTTNPIPVGITDLYLQVIFKGTLGNETDIAVAVGFKDLNEPHHFSIWNATDRFYLDEVLRTADEIRNDPILLSRVDFDMDGIVNETEIGEPYIDPYNVTTNIAFYPPATTPTIYNATFTPLPPGRYGRIIILTDMPEFYIRIHRESTNPPENIDSDYLAAGVTNQENEGIFYNTNVITFRGIIQHHWAAYARYYPDSTGISTAPWPVPANTDPYPPTTLYP
jgi:hypothetical protein